MPNRNVEWVYFRGKGKWIRILKPDVEYNCWNLSLYLDQPSIETFMQLKEPRGNEEGILNELKTDEGTGELYVVLRRPVTKEFKGKVTAFRPPIVVDKENKPWLPHIGIGNGSDLTVKVERYGYNKRMGKGGRGSAIRLVSVRVEELVPFEMKKDFTEEELKAVDGLLQQPPPAMF